MFYEKEIVRDEWFKFHDYSIQGHNHKFKHLFKINKINNLRSAHLLKDEHQALLSLAGRLEQYENNSRIFTKNKTLRSAVEDMLEIYSLTI